MSIILQYVCLILRPPSHAAPSSLLLLGHRVNLCCSALAQKIDTEDSNDQPTAAAGIGFCIVWGYFCEQGASKLHLVNQQHVSCHPTKAKHYNNILASLTEDCSTLHCIVYRSLSLNGTITIMAGTIYRCAVVWQPQLRNRFEEGSLLLFLTSLPLPDNRHFCLRVTRHKSAFIRTLLSNIYRKMVLLYSTQMDHYCLGVEQRQIGCKKRQCCVAVSPLVESTFVAFWSRGEKISKLTAPMETNGFCQYIRKVEGGR